MSAPRRRLALLSFIALASTLAACTSQGSKPAGLAPGADVVRVDVSTDYLPGSPVAIDIENEGGDVSVIVDSTLTKPVVRATSLQSSRQREAAPWAAATLSPSGVPAKEAAPILRVLASDLSQAKRRTNIEVRVPACAGLRVRNRDGGVSLNGVSGAIDVQNGSPLASGGPITLDTDIPLDAPLLLRTSGGPIDVVLPVQSKLALKASSAEGSVIVNAMGVKTTGLAATKLSWQATVNAGQSEGTIATESGDVSIRFRQ